MYVLPVRSVVGHVLVVPCKLDGKQQWECNLAKQHRNTIAHPSCCRNFNKIVASLTEQLVSLIIDPILLICVDLGRLWDSFFNLRGSLLVSLGTLGVTFGITLEHLGTTLEHL